MVKNKTEDNRMDLRIILVIISISFLQLSSTAIAQAIVEIKDYYASTSVTLVQVLYTLPAIFIALSALLMPFLRKWLLEKQIILLSLSLIILAGVMTLLAHEKIYLLYLYSIILGLGIGPIMPISSNLASNQFEPKKRIKVLNYQMASASIGGIVICLSSGILVARNWFNYGYVFLLAIPVLILCWICWPNEIFMEEKDQPSEKTRKVDPATIVFCIIGFIFGISYFTFTANIALHLNDIGLGDSSLAGVASSVLLCGGILGAVAFLKFPGKYDMALILTGFIALGVGLIVFSRSNIWPLLIFACIIGGLSNSVIMSRSFNILAKLVNRSVRTFSFSVFTASFQTGAFLSAIVINSIADLFGDNTLMERCTIAGMLSLIVVVILGFSTIYHRRRSKTLSAEQSLI